MKKRAIPITIGISALALALLVASLSTPDVRIAAVDTERIILEADGDCTFHLWLSAAADCASCEHRGGTHVVSATRLSRYVANWDALPMEAPPEDGCACGHWYCWQGDRWYGGEFERRLSWRVFLPLVVADE